MDQPRPPAHKRTRSSSSASSASSSSATSETAPESKSLRAQGGSSGTYTCTLAPTCDLTPTTHATAAALASHNQLFHSHVCHAPALPPPPPPPHASNSSPPATPHPAPPSSLCHRVFPSAHLLSLHLSELHSPLNPLLPTPYACLDPACTHRFKSPKGRRLHVIEKHGYPKEWFFGVVVWGVEGVLAKGGGMVRREWKPGPPMQGEGKGKSKTAEDTADTSVQGGGVAPTGPASAPMAVTSSSEDEHEQRPWSPPDSPEQGWLSLVRPPEQAASEAESRAPEASMDDLGAALEGVSLTMVPRSVLKARARAQAKAKAMDVEGAA